MTILPPRAVKSAMPWTHFVILVAVVSLSEVVRSVLGGLGAVQTLGQTLMTSYAWVPALAAVAVSINRVDRRTVRVGLGICVVAVTMMVAIDVLIGLVRPSTARLIGMRSGGEIVLSASAVLTQGSWLETLLSWLRGDLAGFQALDVARYPSEHLRPVVAHDVARSGFLLLTFAMMGVVLAASRWVSDHVRFDRHANESAAQVVLAWLIAGILGSIATVLADVQVARALFNGGALWTILIPYLVLLAVGILGFMFASRPHVPRSASTPPIDDRYTAHGG